MANSGEGGIDIEGVDAPPFSAGALAGEPQTFPMWEQPIAGQRTLAGLLDLVPLAFVSWSLADWSSNNGTVNFTLSGLRLLIAATVTLGYYFVAEALTGTTPGKRLLGLTVVDLADGTPPGVGAVAKRTLLRLVDGLPVFYLVGFIAMLSSPSKGRLGDMVASTKVISTQRIRSPLPRSRKVVEAVTLAAVVAATLGVGVAGLVHDDAAAVTKLGAFEYEADIVPLVDRVMKEGLGELSAAVFAELMPPEVAGEEELQSNLERFGAAAGAWSGSYEIVRHGDVRQETFAEFGPERFSVMEILVETTFSAGRVRVFILVGDFHGELRLLSWQVAGSTG